MFIHTMLKRWIRDAYKGLPRLFIPGLAFPPLRLDPDGHVPMQLELPNVPAARRV